MSQQDDATGDVTRTLGWIQRRWGVDVAREGHDEASETLRETLDELVLEAASPYTLA